MAYGEGVKLYGKALLLEQFRRTLSPVKRHHLVQGAMSRIKRRGIIGLWQLGDVFVEISTQCNHTGKAFGIGQPQGITQNGTLAKAQQMYLCLVVGMDFHKLVQKLQDQFARTNGFLIIRPFPLFGIKMDAIPRMTHHR